MVGGIDAADHHVLAERQRQREQGLDKGAPDTAAADRGLQRLETGPAAGGGADLLMKIPAFSKPRVPFRLRLGPHHSSG